VSTNGRLDFAELDAAIDRRRKVQDSLRHLALVTDTPPEPPDYVDFSKGFVLGLALSTMLWAGLVLLVWLLGIPKAVMLALLLVGCACVVLGLAGMERDERQRSAGRLR
jgi:hypothetical protein